MEPNDSSTELAGQTVQKFLRLYRYLRQYARQVDERGILPREFSVLRFLAETGSATVGQVQEYLYCSPSVASTVISNMEEKNLVLRTRSTEDNRVVIVSLTESGAALAAETPMGGIVLLRRRLPTLPPAQIAAIDSALTDLLRLMDVPEAE
jgi:DNA-binding MarR family transcriptional regulator